MAKTSQTKPTGNKVLRDLRAELGFSQREFAEKVGLSEIYISKLETGTFKIGAEAGLKVYGRYRHLFAGMGLECEDLLRSGR
jgi:transcriptional regulator with XRE-family HTH domain